ncbi:MAG: long-chain-fatty-acid--CoA ligase [Pseudomonadota bacterium]
MQLIGEMLDNTVKAYPDKDVVIFEDSGMTYKELNQKINRLSNGLKNLGVSKGDRVMVQLVNGPEIIMSHYAIIKLGAVAVPLNVMYVAREVSYIGGDTEAKAIILDKGFLPILQEVRPSLPALEHLIVLGDPVPEGAHRFDDLISDHSHRIEPYDAGFDDVVNIIYTSGTTGRPKGATQTHRSVLSNAASFWNFNKFTGDDRLLCALPLFNNFGIVVMMCTLYCGGTIILVDRFEGEKVLGHITRHKATYFAGTPTMYIYLLQAYDPVRHNVESLRVVNSGGAHCPVKVIEDVEKTFGVIFLDGYGLTESCGYTTLNPLVGIRKRDSVGVPAANIWVKIVDDNMGELLPRQVGEIVGKGDLFSVHGYWNRPEINKEAYKDGWFRTWDLGYLDEDGYLYVVDRKQDLIITGGANIYPAEVEEVLYTHPAVAMAAVIGIPDEVKGELAKAYIVLKEGTGTTEKEIIDYVRGKMAKYKAPRMVQFVNTLPQGPTGKIMKRELRERVLGRRGA